jgi:hypothetical protein
VKRETVQPATLQTAKGEELAKLKLTRGRRDDRLREGIMREDITPETLGE